MIRRYVARTDGQAFVLFTSYEMMKRVAADLTPWLAEQEPGAVLPGRRPAAHARCSSSSKRTRGRCCSAPTASGKASTCRATRCRT